MDQKAEMTALIQRWMRWYRLRRAATWSIHGLVIGLALGLLVSLAAVYRGQLLRHEFLTLVFLISAAGLALGGSTGFAWWSSRLKAARFFDLQFGLQERTSTALEWAGDAGLDREREPLLSKQFSDALAAARLVDVRVRLPVRIARQEILIALIFAVGALLSSYWGRPFFQAEQEQRAVQQAIAGETAEVEAILDEIQNASRLAPDQREALAAPLEAARRQLQEAQTLEQAVSILTRAEEELSGLSDPGVQAQMQSLREVGQDWTQAQEGALQEGPLKEGPLKEGSLQQTGEQLAGGDAGAAAQTLKDLDLSQAGAVEREALARQLEEAGRALAQTDPGLAEQLDAAAADLRAGDAQAAQQDLQEAARQLSEAGEGMEGSAQAGRAAAEVGAARQRLLQQAGSGRPLAGEGNTAGEGQSTGSGQVGSTAGQGSANGQQSASGEPGGAGSAAGSGAGRGESAGENGAGGPAGAGPIDQGNRPGDGGERPYEPISPPQQLGGTGGEVVTLPGGDESGDRITGQGDLPFDRPGQSQVPYTEVFPQYAETYRQAIESGQVPLLLRPVVRDYFSSLDPLP